MSRKINHDVEELCNLFLSHQRRPAEHTDQPSTSNSIRKRTSIWQEIEGDDEDEMIFGSDGKPNPQVGRSERYFREGNFLHKTVQRLKISEETDLIDLEETIGTIIDLRDSDDDEVSDKAQFSTSLHRVESSTSVLSNSVNPNLLPYSAIIYDYTMQPVSAREQNRRYLPNLRMSSSPLLRPIVIDGVGLVKAYRNCCCTNTTYFPFPIVPIIRCMFYWISKGHSTVLCFPSRFNPIDDEVFNAIPDHKEVLRILRRFRMCVIFNPEDGQQSCTKPVGGDKTVQSFDANRRWYANVLEDQHACLITTVSQWRLSMPNNLIAGVITRSDGLNNYSVNSSGGRSAYHEARPERLLQPFFSHEGKLVFFSSFSSQGACVVEMILDNTVMSPEEFRRLNDNQLTFIEQARMLKVLHSFIPATSRFREAAVMVKILERLKPFLP